eukprot:g4155.t1
MKFMKNTLNMATSDSDQPAESEEEEKNPILTIDDCDEMYDKVVQGGDETRLIMELWNEKTCSDAREKGCVNRAMDKNILNIRGTLVTFKMFAELAALSASPASAGVSAIIQAKEIVSYIALDKFFEPPLNRVFLCEGSKPREPGHPDCTAPLDEAEPKTIVILDSEAKLSKRQRFCIKCESKFDDNKHKIPWLYVAWEEDDSDTREGDLRTGKAYLAKMIPDRDVKREEDLEESDGDSSHEKDLEESDGDSSHEEDLEESDDDVCTNVKSFYPADSIVCDSRMVKKVWH